MLTCFTIWCFLSDKSFVQLNIENRKCAKAKRFSVFFQKNKRREQIIFQKYVCQIIFRCFTFYKVETNFFLQKTSAFLQKYWNQDNCTFIFLPKFYIISKLPQLIFVNLKMEFLKCIEHFQKYLLEVRIYLYTSLFIIKKSQFNIHSCTSPKAFVRTSFLFLPEYIKPFFNFLFVLTTKYFILI